jgi:hypothetical protein
MLFRKIIAVHSDNHTKLINKLKRKNAKLPTVKPGGTYSYQWALKA